MFSRDEDCGVFEFHDGVEKGTFAKRKEDFGDFWFRTRGLLYMCAMGPMKQNKYFVIHSL